MPQVMLAQALAKEPPEDLEAPLEVPPVAEASSKRHVLSRHASQEQKLARGAARAHPAHHSGAQGVSTGTSQRTREEARLSNLISAPEEGRRHPSAASRTNAPAALRTNASAALRDVVVGVGEATGQEREEQQQEEEDDEGQESGSGSTLWASLKHRLPDVLEAGRRLPAPCKLPSPRRASRESIQLTSTGAFRAPEAGFEHKDAPPSARRKLSRSPSIPLGLLQRSSSLQPMTETEQTPAADLAEVSSALGRASVMAQLEIEEALDSPRLDS
jgi:hypothetical protein